MQRNLLFTGCLLLAGALAACGDDDDSNSPQTPSEQDPGTDDDDDDDDDDDVTEPPGEPAFTLQLLHFADMDGNEDTILTAVENFSALVDGFRKDENLGENTLVVSSGDNMIPGPRWFAVEDRSVRALTGSNEPGHMDHYVMNQLGVAASALGNHDLDQGPGEFTDTLQAETYTPDPTDDDPEPEPVEFEGAKFPYLAANVDFTTDSDTSGLQVEPGQDVNDIQGKLTASATVAVGGELIGLVGVSTPELSDLANTGELEISGSVEEITELASAVQPAVDALIEAGINKVVLLTHLQNLNYERSLATELSGVDVIVAGGSNTRMGNPESSAVYPGDEEFVEAYPFTAEDKEQTPVLIVNVDGDYKYLGRLVVSFDEAGVVIPTTIEPDQSGAFASIPENVTEVGGTPIPEVVEVRDAVREVINIQYNNVIGHTEVFIEGRREKVRTEETNLGNLSADANKWYAQSCDELTNVLSLKNGGGIRSEIGDYVVNGSTQEFLPPNNTGLETAEPGDVSEGHLRGTLRFDNGLVVIDVNGSQLKMLLEHAVSGTSTEGGSTGTFPQVGGIWFGFNPANTAQEIVDGAITTEGERITDLYVDTDADGTPDTALYIDGVEQVAAADTYNLVTLNFLANGGDDFPFSLIENANRRQLYEGLAFGDPDEGDDEEPDFPVLTSCDPGQNETFSQTGNEQDAMAEYFLATYPDADNAYTDAETPPEGDRRVQNLSIIESFEPPIEQ